MSALDDFLAKAPDAQKRLIRQLHNLITEAFPSLESSIKWSNSTYHHDYNIYALVFHENHINLQVWGGAEITDPKNVMKGTGKRMRHIKIRDWDELNYSYIMELLKEAVRKADTCILPSI